MPCMVRTVPRVITKPAVISVCGANSNPGLDALQYCAGPSSPLCIIMGLDTCKKKYTNGARCMGRRDQEERGRRREARCTCCPVEQSGKTVGPSCGSQITICGTDVLVAYEAWDDTLMI